MFGITRDRILTLECEVESLKGTNRILREDLDREVLALARLREDFIAIGDYLIDRFFSK